MTYQSTGRVAKMNGISFYFYFNIACHMVQVCVAMMEWDES